MRNLTAIRISNLRANHVLNTKITLRSLSTSRKDISKLVQSDHYHCVHLVQNRDREGYLCGLLMPASARSQYFALRAFNVEIASVKDGSDLRRNRGSSENGSSIGLQLRMQWWREALDEVFRSEDASEARSISVEPVSDHAANYWKNPVVRALDRAVRSSNLTRRFLERMLDAREADLNIQQMPTIESAMLYAEDSCSSLLYLSLECCDIRDDASDEVASNVGVGWGLVTAIRSAPYRALNQDMSIPLDLLVKQIPADYLVAKQDPEFQGSSDNDEILREAVRHMAYVASRHLTRAADTQLDVPRGGRAALLPAIPAMHYLIDLKDANYDLFDPKFHTDNSKLFMLAMLGRSWFTGRI
mmetsp:Transcript_30736/g.35044  ORF Transcript_30736/g.35044 Transcript_30736/m.35044 type:complete len:358 (-) Transcript_30736:78-1151(-)